MIEIFFWLRCEHFHLKLFALIDIQQQIYYLNQHHYRSFTGFSGVFEKFFKSFSFERLSVNLYVMVFVGLTSIVLLKLNVYFCVKSICLVSLFVYLDDEVTKVVTNNIFVVSLFARFSYVITKSVFFCRYLCCIKLISIEKNL